MTSDVVDIEHVIDTYYTSDSYIKQRNEVVTRNLIDDVSDSKQIETGVDII